MVPLEQIDGLFAYARALTRNRYEAEDLVQETYLRAIQAMGRLREDGNANRLSQPRAYLAWSFISALWLDCYHAGSLSENSSFVA